MQRVRGDQGAAAIVTILSLVVVLGVGAVVVDVGAMLQERRVLQNGADAGALAIATQCGTGDCGDPNASGDDYANANADDGESTVEELCGSGVTGQSACADPPASLPAGANYVRVTTKTSADGGDKLPFGFGQFLGLDGTTLRAQAVAAWGGPVSLTSGLPLTISECEFDTYTNDGDDLAPPPPYTTYPSEVVIFMHDTTGASTCPAGPAGSDLPGGFGWLETTTECNATSDTLHWFDDKTGRPPPTSCTWQLMETLVGKIVAVPVFDATNGLTGTNGSYHMIGYAAFYLTGYSIEGQYRVKSLVTGTYPCSGQASCISGFFVDSPAPVEGTIGGPSMGVTVVDLIQ